MISKPGYYSLVQYCPDRTRMETANVGVLLFCPGWDFLGIRTASEFGRIKQFFRREEYDPDRLRSTLESLKKRIEITKKNFRDKDDLVRFIDTRANEIVITPPRAMKVGKPDDELEALYKELLGRKAKEKRTQKPIIPELEEVFARPPIENRIQRNVRIQIPLTGDTIEVPYAYRNGVQNLVRPVRFPESERHARERSKQLAIEGDLIQKESENGDRKKIIVVAKLPDTGLDQGFAHRLRDLLGRYEVDLKMMGEIESLAEDILRTAH